MGRSHDQNAVTNAAAQPVSWLRASVIASAIGVLLLAVSAYPIVRQFFSGLGGGRVLDSVTAQSDIALPLLLRVATYIGVAVSLHVALGLAAVLLAWCTLRAFPSQGPARLQFVFLWSAVLFAWVLVTNAAWFPRTELGEPYATLVTSQIGPVSFSELFGWSLAAAIAMVVVMAVVGSIAHGLGGGRERTRLARRVALVGLAAAGVITFSVLVREPAAAARSDASRPHVIIIGADSLRLDMLRAFDGNGDTPTLDRLLEGAHVFRDTTTPQARTFPSWMSILTGRHTRSTAALFNLVARDRVTPGDTLAHLLGQRGYRTVFATDEVRFSNIDESYGFDQRVTPVIGASDFVLGSIADIPLLNLVNGTRIGRYLLPDTHANRAAATTYLPEHFTQRLIDEVAFEEPTFLAVHFSASHWPFHVANSPRIPAVGEKAVTQYAEYRESVRVADAQIGEFVDSLRQRGVLNNAIVVLLSDHGEAMQRPGDTLLQQADQRLFVSQWGHGTSVLSPSQYQVLLGFAAFGNAAAGVTPGMSDAPASLEDVTPTILDLLGFGSAGQSFDGRSLRQFVAGGPAPADARTRIRFTETDFNLPRMLAGDFNVKWLAEMAVDYYQVNPQSGWVELRPERIAALVSYKERAAIQGEWLLAAMPGSNGTTLYALVNRNSGMLRILDTVPSADAGDPAGLLFEALHRRFPGELGPLTTGAVPNDTHASVTSDGRHSASTADINTNNETT